MSRPRDIHREIMLLEEYKEAGQLHRLHIGLMFGHFAVFLAATGAIVARYLDLPAASEHLRLACAAIGATVAYVIFAQHERIHAYSFAARERARNIQSLLGLSLYDGPVVSKSALGRASAYLVTRWFYLIAVLAWTAIASKEIWHRLQ